MYRGRSLFLNTSLHYMQLFNDHIYHLATVDMGNNSDIYRYQSFDEHHDQLSKLVSRARCPEGLPVFPQSSIHLQDLCIYPV